MHQDQYLKGLATIRSEIDQVMADQGILAGAIAITEGGMNTRAAIVSITAKGKTETATFTYSEIEDSGEAIDAPAAVKVRMLVSHFLG